MATQDAELQRKLRLASIKARVGGLFYVLFGIGMVALMLYNAGGETEFASSHDLPNLGFMTPFMVLLGAAACFMGLRALVKGAPASERNLISERYEAEQREAPKKEA